MDALAEKKPLKKTAQIAESLRQMVQKIGPDAKLPTYLELLSSLSVSRTTLNAALDELESQRVIYRRHGVGIFAASPKRGYSVALLCNPLFFQGKTHSPFWDVLLEQARERALKEDFFCEVHFCKSQGNAGLPFSDNLLHSLQRGHLQGVLGVGMNYATSQWLKGKGVPYVSFGGPGNWNIGVDYTAIIQQGVQALAERGCRHLALLHPITPYRDIVQVHNHWETQVEVFRLALMHHGLLFERDRVAMQTEWLPAGTTTITSSHEEQGHLAVQRLFKGELPQSEKPDGLLFTDDVMAMGGMAALREINLQPGRDIQLATHANRGTTVLAPYEAVLTRMEIDPAEIVDGLFSILRDLMDDKPSTESKGTPISSSGSRQVYPALRRQGEPS
jgi:DNA-binding LacI/PurR family transcriptional regulator